MKALAKKIRREWEQTLFWVSVGVFVLTVLLRLIGFGGHEASVPTRKDMPLRKPILSDAAFAFLEAAPKLDVEANNPFGTVVERRPPVRRPWQDQKPKAEPPKPAPAEPPRAAEPPKRAEPPKALPPKPPVTRVVEYLGCTTTPSGAQVGYVETVDPASKKKSRSFVQKGGKLEGVEVQSFSEDALEVRDAKGRVHRIPFGEKKTIAVE